MDLSLVLLGSNFTDLLWFKEGWFHILQLRGKWCLLILGGFPKIVLIINYFIVHIDYSFYEKLLWDNHTMYIYFTFNLGRPTQIKNYVYLFVR